MDSSPGAGVGPFRPRGIGDILSAAFELYKAHWQTLIGLVAIVVVPLTLVEYLLREAFEENVTIDPNTLEVSSNFGRTILVASLASLIGLLITQVLTGAITRASAGTLVGEVPTASDAYRFGFSKLGSILLIGLLVALVVVGGFILLIIPGIFFAVKLAVSIPALVVEDARGTSAMSRSWNLVAGNFWHVIGTVVVASIITGILSGIIAAIFGDNWFLAGIGASIGRIITTPYTALVIMLVYIDLRVRKEAYTAEGLRMDLRSPGGGGTGGAPGGFGDPPGGFGGTPPPPPPPLASG